MADVPPLDRWVRVTLWLSCPFNLFAAWLFFYPASAPAQALGLPPAAPLIAPLGGPSHRRPSYVWMAVGNATWYQLWVNDAAGSPRIRR